MPTFCNITLGWCSDPVRHFNCDTLHCDSSKYLKLCHHSNARWRSILANIIGACKMLFIAWNAQYPAFLCCLTHICYIECSTTCYCFFLIIHIPVPYIVGPALFLALHLVPPNPGTCNALRQIATTGQSCSSTAACDGVDCRYINYRLSMRLLPCNIPPGIRLSLTDQLSGRPLYDQIISQSQQITVAPFTYLDVNITQRVNAIGLKVFYGYSWDYS